MHSGNHSALPGEQLRLANDPLLQGFGLHLVISNHGLALRLELLLLVFSSFWSLLGMIRQQLSRFLFEPVLAKARLLNSEIQLRQI